MWRRSGKDQTKYIIINSTMFDHFTLKGLLAYFGNSNQIAINYTLTLAQLLQTFDRKIGHKTNTAHIETVLFGAKNENI